MLACLQAPVMPGLRHLPTSTPCIMIGCRRACKGHATHMQPLQLVVVAMPVP